MCPFLALGDANSLLQCGQIFDALVGRAAGRRRDAAAFLVDMELATGEAPARQGCGAALVFSLSPSLSFSPFLAFSL